MLKSVLLFSATAAVASAATVNIVQPTNCFFIDTAKDCTVTNGQRTCTFPIKITTDLAPSTNLVWRLEGSQGSAALGGPIPVSQLTSGTTLSFGNHIVSGYLAYSIEGNDPYVKSGTAVTVWYETPNRIERNVLEGDCKVPSNGDGVNAAGGDDNSSTNTNTNTKGTTNSTTSDALSETMNGMIAKMGIIALASVGSILYFI